VLKKIGDIDSYTHITVIARREQFNDDIHI